MPEELSILVGKLEETLPEYDLPTIQHSDELTQARTEDTKNEQNLRDKWFWTGDMGAYYEKGGIVMFGLTRADGNLIFQNPETAIPEIRKTGNYRFDAKSLDQVVQSEGYMEWNTSKLGLQRHNDEFSYIEIDTSNYDRLNSEDRRLAERVFGQGEAFIKAMDMLKEAKIQKTRIWVINPEYVKKNAPSDGGLGRACLLDDFNSYSSFDANNRNLGVAKGALRGVRAQKIDYAGIAESVIDQRFRSGTFAQSLTDEGIARLGETIAAYHRKQ